MDMKNKKKKLHVVITINPSKKVKQSRYTPWRRLGGEEV
jgi:hypothetical protein